MEKSSKLKVQQSFSSEIIAKNKVGLQAQIGLKHNLSIHAKHYRQYFNRFQSTQTEQSIQNYIQKLGLNKIIYRPDHFCSSLEILVLNDTDASKVFNLLVSLSFFTFQISLLNIPRVSVFSSCLPKICYGGSANLLLFQLPQSEKFIIKSVSTQKDQKCEDQQKLVLPTSLREAVKQYCLTKLFSALEMGPKVLNYFGFDMVLSEKAIEFCLEKCEPAKQINEAQLAKDLKVIHDFGIVHGDIKCQNVMYSNQYKKTVFIDFGLSRALNQKPGETTLTYFFGSFGYCSQEMEGLLFKKSLGFVDLYYNDIYCLQKSVKKQKLQQNLQIISVSENKNHIAIKFLCNLKLMKLIADRNISAILSLLEKYKFEVMEEAFQVLSYLPYESSALMIFRLLQKYKYQDMGYKQSQNRTEQQLLGKNNDLKRFFFQLGSQEGTKIRISESLRSELTFPWLMVSLLVFFSEDVTPRAHKRKFEVRETLKGMKNINQIFCQLLVQYISNLYTTEDEILEIFKFTLSILKSGQGQQKVKRKTPKYLIYQHALEIASLLLQQFSINIFDVYKRAQLQRRLTKETISTSDYQFFLDYFVQSGQGLKSIQLNDLIVWIDPQQISGNFKNQRRFSIKFIQNRRTLNIVNLEEHKNSFLFLCSNFYTTSKCLKAKQNAEMFQILFFFSKNFSHFLLAQQKRSEISINYSFDIKVAFYFLMANTIEEKMMEQTNLQQIDQKISKIKRFLDLFYCLEVAQTFTNWLYMRIYRIREYQLYSDKPALDYWMKKMSEIHKELLYLYLQNTNMITPKTLSALIRLYTLLLKFVDRNEVIQLIQLFVQLKSEADFWKDTRFSVEQCFSLLKCKILLFQALNILSEVRMQKILLQLQNHLSRMKPLIRIESHLLFLKHFLISSDFTTCQQHASSIQILSKSISDQFYDCLEVLTFEPYIQLYFSLKPVQNFGRLTDFVHRFLYLYNLTQHQINQQQFNLYVFLRGALANYLHPNLVIQIIQLYIEQHQKLRNKETGRYNAIYGNSIVLFQMLLCSILGQNLLLQMKALISIPKVLKAVYNLVPFSSIFIKKRFTQKYAYFISEAIRIDLLKPKSKRTTRIWQRRKFRSCQYLFDGAQQTLFTHKTKAKKLNCLPIQGIKYKLEQWNTNKIKAPICNSISLLSEYRNSYQSILHQKFPWGINGQYI